MTEKQFQQRVIKFLKEQGTYVINMWGGGRFTRAGIPDLIVCVNGYFIAVELKTETGKPTKLQEWNIDQIKESGGHATVLRPNQFDEFKYFIQEVKRWPRYSFRILE